MRRTAAATALVGLLLVGCGSTKTKTITQSGPKLPFPPQAAEPAPSPAHGPKPAGRVVRVGAKPEGVAVDPKSGLAAVTVHSPDGVALVDPKTGRTVKRVKLPASARHLQLAKPGGPFLVPLEDTDQLAEVSPSGKVRLTKVGDNPHDATAIGDRIYVGDEFSSTLSTVRDGKLLSTVPVDAQPGGVAAVDGDEIAVTAVRAYSVQLFHAGDHPSPVEGSQNTGYGPSHVVADGAGRLYVADGRGDGVSVFTTRPKLRFSARIPTGGSPLGLAVDDARHRVWVTLTDRDRAIALSQADQPKVVDRVATVAQPNSIGVDPRTGMLLIPSRADGTLQLVTP